MKQHRSWLAAAAFIAAAATTFPPPSSGAKVSSKLSGILKDFLDSLDVGYASDGDRAADRGAVLSQRFDGLQTPEGGTRVVVDIAGEDTGALRTSLMASGVEVGPCKQYLCSATLAVEGLEELVNSIDEISFVQPVIATTNAGSVLSEAGFAMNSEPLLDLLEVTGDGITIGILSDSFNCLNGTDVFTEDLPRSYLIEQEIYDCTSGGDEGRAMMQLIHDVAPDAKLAFHTGFGGQPAFAQAIRKLVDAGANVLVDDVLYENEPMFQDGVIAQTANEVVEEGILYFSSAGNFARNSWEGPFVDSGVPGNNGGTMHDFGDSYLQKITFDPNSPLDSFHVVLNWDEPFFSVSGPPGSKSDIDMFIFVADPLGEDFTDKDNKTYCLKDSAVTANVGRDPFEVATAGGTVNEIYLMFERFEGPPPGLMKWIISSTTPILEIEHGTNSGTIYGHANAENVAAVGAAYFMNTPNYDVIPPLQETFTSAGGTPILFDERGKRMKEAEIRRTPLVVGPDGNANTFLGNADAFFGNTGPSDPALRFFGTSASAANVAAVAGLLLSYNDNLSPCDVYEALAETAIDMDDKGTPGADAGYDLGTG